MRAAMAPTIIPVQATLRDDLLTIGNPVAMPYPDTYAALQQGVIDGLEGSILSFYGTKQYENVKGTGLKTT